MFLHVIVNLKKHSLAFFPPIPSTEFKVKFDSKFRGLSFRNFENKDPS